MRTVHLGLGGSKADYCSSGSVYFNLGLSLFREFEARERLVPIMAYTAGRPERDAFFSV